MSKESMEVIARMTDTEINMRDLVSKWILITYDLPHTEAGDKARREFLMQAKSIGAARHTDSVYLLPWTPSAELLALQLSRVGDVVLWTSSTTDEGKAKEITQSYDKGIEPILDEISERIDRISDYEIKHYLKRANKMIPKTERMLNEVEQTIMRRGSVSLYLMLQIIKKRFAIVA